jgi:hypothetical protein
MSYSLQMLGGVALTDASGEDAGVPHGKPMDLVAYLAMQQGGPSGTTWRGCFGRVATRPRVVTPFDPPLRGCGGSDRRGHRAPFARADDGRFGGA